MKKCTLRSGSLSRAELVGATAQMTQGLSDRSVSSINLRNAHSNLLNFIGSSHG
jgi:hypothetical protein